MRLLLQQVRFCNLVGYGDIVPLTLIGRLITVFNCLLGIFLISILISAFAVYSSLDEWELKAYNDIKKLYNNEENKYVFDFMKMKVQRIGFNKIRYFRKYEISRSNYRYLLMKRHMVPFHVYYEKLFSTIEKTHNTISAFSKRLYLINPAIINLHIKAINTLELFKDSRDNSYRLLNLMNMIIYLKSIIPVKSNYNLFRFRKCEKKSNTL